MACSEYGPQAHSVLKVAESFPASCCMACSEYCPHSVCDSSLMKHWT